MSEILENIFCPHVFERQKAVMDGGIRFVHYTSAEAAMNILRTKEIWMRKTSCMDDFMEIVHGSECLASAYRTGEGGKLKEALERLFPGIVKEI